MAILNRTEDSSTQRLPLNVCVNGAQTNGETGILAHVPCPAVLEGANFAAFNPTAQVTIQFYVNRFIAGTGYTSWSLGSAFIPTDFGVSGVLAGGISLPGSGSTLSALMANDVLGYQIAGGATAAIYGIVGTFVVRPLQDVRTFLNGLV